MYYFFVDTVHHLVALIYSGHEHGSSSDSLTYLKRVSFDESLSMKAPHNGTMIGKSRTLVRESLNMILFSPHSFLFQK